MKKILTIVGARPQFVKAAVVSKALAVKGIQEDLIHTGQHYDHSMSTIFFEELGIPSPSKNLEVGSGSHGVQTGIMLQKIESYILDLEEFPDALLVYGDTNSTLAGALVASKLHIPVIHVEAGLRSFNKEMPEEINRILTDHASDVLFCSSNEGARQLSREGITKNVYCVGDVMYDALLTFSEIASKRFSLDSIVPFEEDSFYLATIHRPSNTDNLSHLEGILSAFSELDKPIVWPVHPRNKSTLKSMDLPKNLQLLDPVSYFQMLILLTKCSKVLTDSGGLQKEAYWMQKQCVTLREETEWVETLEGNWNQLTGADPRKIVEAVKSTPIANWKTLYGDGTATKQIAQYLQKY